MPLRILVTNDDGIDAIGLQFLVEHAKKYGKVLVAAPKYEQSAKSQAIEVRKSFECKKIDKFEGVDTYVIDSTPADCVRFAKYGLHLDYDIVLSGINKGLNLGEDIWYSGTVAATYEAVSTKAKAIAFSVVKDSNDGFKYFEDVMDYILNNDLFKYADIFNVNIPKKSKGIKITRQGGSMFSTEFTETSKGYYLAGGDWVVDKSMENIMFDATCVENGYISITPLTGERTDIDAFNQINKKDLK